MLCTCFYKSAECNMCSIFWLAYFHQTITEITYCNFVFELSYRPMGLFGKKFSNVIPKYAININYFSCLHSGGNFGHQWKVLSMSQAQGLTRRNHYAPLKLCISPRRLPTEYAHCSPILSPVIITFSLTTCYFFTTSKTITTMFHLQWPLTRAFFVRIVKIKNSIYC